MKQHRLRKPRPDPPQYAQALCGLWTWSEQFAVLKCEACERIARALKAERAMRDKYRRN